MMTLNKRGKLGLFFLILIIILLIIKHYLPKNYEIKYKVNNYSVEEKYLKDKKIYTYKISKNKLNYYFVSNDKYSTHKKNINKIKEYKKKNTKCIYVESDKIDNKILCNKDNVLIDYHLTNNIVPKKYYKKTNKKSLKYKNINVINKDDKEYYIWDYSKFIKIGEENTTIPILKNDVYNIPLTLLYDNYLVMADYSKKYNFKKFIVIDLDTNKKSEIEYLNDISFESRFLGGYKNSIYLIDEKNKIEYEINLKKETVDKVGNYHTSGKILENNELKEYSINSIINKELKFDYGERYSYKIKKDGLYMVINSYNKEIKISDKNIKRIVYNQNDYIYYISEDKLYKFDFKYGEKEVLSYFELNFNFDNIIYIK